MAPSAFQELTEQPSWVLLFLSLGSWLLLKVTFIVLNWVYASFLRPPKNLHQYGSWALVTCPTDGIGRGFALQLAKRGLNLVLVGRNPQKLETLAATIASKFSNVQTKTVIMDFSGDLELGVKGIKSAIEGIDLGILINNAGLSYPYAKHFHEVDDRLLHDLIKINVEGTTKVTSAVLPSMLKKKKGAIVNVGSGVAKVIPCEPLYGVYSATKGFIEQFSRCLHVEYGGQGIEVQCQVPLYVATKMTAIREADWFAPSAEDYADAGLRAIGYGACCSPFWSHSLAWMAVRLVPDSLVNAWRLRVDLRVREKGLLRAAMKKRL